MSSSNSTSSSSPFSYSSSASWILAICSISLMSSTKDGGCKHLLLFLCIYLPVCLSFFILFCLLYFFLPSIFLYNGLLPKVLINLLLCFHSSLAGELLVVFALFSALCPISCISFNSPSFSEILSMAFSSLIVWFLNFLYLLFFDLLCYLTPFSIPSFSSIPFFSDIITSYFLIIY